MYDCPVCGIEDEPRGAHGMCEASESCTCGRFPDCAQICPAVPVMDEVLGEYTLEDDGEHVLVAPA